MKSEEETTSDWLAASAQGKKQYKRSNISSTYH